jgi:putative nucleotidyltransferase with HDIG domain
LHADSGDFGALFVLMRTLQRRSVVTAHHCVRVARYATAMAEALGLSEQQVRRVECCGLLHDVGKLGISRDVLDKPGPLDPLEWRLMRTHTQIGVRVLQTHGRLASILPAVAMHHERFDGRGYPYGAKGTDIPLEARILAVCDAYDTMTSNRPYRQALSADEALDRIEAGAGTQFDPALAYLFTTQVAPALPGYVYSTATAGA